MEYVAPIKQLHKIRLMKTHLKKKSSRDYLLFVIGINTGLRISELLRLKVEDVRDDTGEIRHFITLHDQSVFLNEQVKRALKYHFHCVQPSQHDCLFSSPRTKKPITRQQAYRIVNDAAKAVGIDGKVGTHTLRKTFGYHAFTKGIAISLIQKRFNQTTQAETLQYIGIEKTEPQKIDVNL
ncbi:tyrosine-type recombinase/integrase [Alteribacillus iranensis]|uniref:Phage integrase family protein n=1 Tax=Alteribacillus iranensis TaxID=930128 RepID=A0A1I2EXM7_9BACI|nr:tyrosine-type recombinase/integrase [Alteribacillus iranensis]SFE97625.1 Phage integrase family protein [Alteribacillus iranensis]